MEEWLVGSILSGDQVVEFSFETTPVPSTAKAADELVTIPIEGGDDDEAPWKPSPSPDPSTTRVYTVPEEESVDQKESQGPARVSGDTGQDGPSIPPAIVREFWGSKERLRLSQWTLQKQKYKTFTLSTECLNWNRKARSEVVYHWTTC
jgi:hypothetical protein